MADATVRRGAGQKADSAQDPGETLLDRAAGPAAPVAPQHPTPPSEALVPRTLRRDALHPETLAVATGYDPESAWGAIKPPLVLTSTFAYRSAQEAKDAHAAHFGEAQNATSGAPRSIYARLGHPNLTMLEERFAALDGAEATAGFASGMAAISTTLLAHASPGTAVLHTTPLYGGTHHFLTETLASRGIEAVAIGDGRDRERLEAAAHGRTVAAIFAETPANPTLDLADIRALADFARSLPCRASRPAVIVDNTFLGPFAQRPLALGADLCITSLTKYAGGHSDVMGGAVSGGRSQVAPLKALRTSLGNHLDPFSAWLLLRSLETLPVRFARAQASAAMLAAFLRDHPRIASVRYLGESGTAEPDALYRRQCSGAGALVSFTLDGGEADAFAFLDRLALIAIAVSLGGSETTICHPASTTHYAVPPRARDALGIDAASLRLSVGLEHPDDLVNDLSQALNAL